MRRVAGAAALALGLVTGADADAGADAEREVIALVAALDGTDAAERESTLRALAPHGARAVDVVLEFMQEGLLPRAEALAAVAALQSGDLDGSDAPAGGAPAPDAAGNGGVDLDRPALADPRADPVQYRVTGVAPHDVLNIRDRPGVPGSTIVGSFAPDATGIARGEASAEAGGGVWWQVLRADLPDGAGWVNARFLELMPAPGPAEIDRAAVAEAFVAGRGYERLDTEIAAALDDVIAPDPDSVFHPAGRLGPLTRAILLLEAREGTLPHARYRLRHGAEPMPDPPGAGTVIVDYLQIDRFNLGPAMHAAAAQTGARAAPAAQFGTGPHVSYRLVTAPIQGVRTNLNAVSRASFGDGDAADASCLRIACLSLAAAAEAVPESWSEMTAAAVTHDPAYPALRNGVHSPAAIMDELALRAVLAEPANGAVRWRAREPREVAGFADTVTEVVIEVGLGQDHAVDGVLRDSHLMDDATAMIWRRVVSVASGDPAAPAVFAAEARAPFPGRQ